MVWQIEFTGSARKQLSKLAPTAARRLSVFLRQRVAGLDNPRSTGKALQGPLGYFWPYRVGDLRIVCDIQDRAVRILVIKGGNRRDVYR